MLVIGNEILTGKIRDQNAYYLSQQLFSLGVRLQRILVIPDIEEEIATAVREMSDAYDIVFTSGGVGPTHDDVTVSGIAAGLGLELERNEQMAGYIRDVYGEHTNEHVLRMADVPKGTELVVGEGLRVPVMVVGNVHIFPGIPELFRSKFDAIRSRFADEPFHLEVVYVKRDESQLAEPLRKITGDFPAVAVGSYPQWSNPHYHVKVTLESKDPDAVTAARDALLELVPAKYIVAPPEGEAS